MTESTDRTDVEAGEWYWDRRTDKAYYARETDDDTVAFITVWHRDETADALDAGAVVPLRDMDFDRSGGTFALKDSFRTRLEDEPAADAHGGC